MIKMLYLTPKFKFVFYRYAYLILYKIHTFPFFYKSTFFCTSILLTLSIITGMIQSDKARRVFDAKYGND